MEYVLLTVVIVGFFASIGAIAFVFQRLLAKLDTYSQKVVQNEEIQKKNTEKLVSLLEKVFIIPTNSPSQEPNQATEIKHDGIEFSEQEPLNLPPDVKFEVEGGDSQIPSGYPVKN